MKCPRCESTSYRKNGHRNGKQYYLCKNCRKQFLEPVLLNTPSPHLLENSNGHSKLPVEEAKELSLREDLPAETSTNTSSPSLATSLAQELLQTFLSPQFLESAAFEEFIAKIRPNFEIQPQSPTGISLLLLDAENLKIDIAAEEFLASIGNYPLQVKIAFANWKTPSNGKQDTELYERGYQLFHVPDGKDGADAKMIAFGASLLRGYPTVKEIFVCSGDGILTHLCNELQNQGLTVYWVRRQSQTLHIENRNTGKFTFYSVPLATEVPSLAGVVDKIENLIKAEQESISSRLSNLTTIANLFQERCNLEFNHNNSALEVKSTASLDTEDITGTVNTTTISIPPQEIASKADLEKLLLEIFQNMQAQSPKSKLSVSKLGTELQKICGQSPNSIMKKLKLGSSFTKFLQSSPHFTLQLRGREYEVLKSVDG
ncbi:MULTISPECIES: IS1/IS1595 family N-terminal zinc-binding domain-containing protein [Calothrix]|uniref:NYN domain-containing protein n=2 Tax=Calothrix TaxID=1186 RepID=A0ABR8A678_9CYAN|nr:MULTISPECIES: NYN domain-containing protein [Calothrix]MBD2194783.1 NYN domain-containing protein [Calothrix parietina FACHB-288]MBD2225067.1 NYN domain-containing protein [Calothrix anomala FACHB-343]